MRWFAIVLLLAVTSTGGVYGQVYDLSLDIVVNAPAVTPIGSSGTLTVTVTNKGPDPAGSAGPFRVFVSSTPLGYSLDYGDLIDYSSPPGPPCLVGGVVPSPPIGGTLKVFYSVVFDELSPGETDSCEVDFTISPFAVEIDPSEVADGVIVQKWDVLATTGADSDFSDNEVTITYLLASQVPTLSPVGLALFALGMGMAFVVVRRRMAARQV